MSVPAASPYLTRALLTPEPVSAEIEAPDEWGVVGLHIGDDPRLLDAPAYRLHARGNCQGPLYLTHAQLCALHAATGALVRAKAAAPRRSVA